MRHPTATGNDIHPTAIVSASAKLGKNVKVGAFAIIGNGVVIGDGTEVMHHATVDKATTVGKDCQLYPYSSLGTDPQDVTFKGEPTFLEIGDNNIIREFTTINRGTAKGGGYTRMGNNNFLMMYTHIGHDCQVGSHTIFTNGATLAGHVEVDDYAVIGAFCSIHQFARIGRNAYIGGYTVVLQDVLPFAKIAQQRDAYNLYGPNSIGMMRNGISREFINNVKSMFNILFKQDLNTTQALDKIKEEYPDLEETGILTEFIAKTRRGITKNFRSRG